MAGKRKSSIKTRTVDEDDELVPVYGAFTRFINEWAVDHRGTAIMRYRTEPEFVVCYTEGLRLRIDFKIDGDGGVRSISYEVSMMDEGGILVLFAGGVDGDGNLRSGEVVSLYDWEEEIYVEADSRLVKALEGLGLTAVWKDVETVVCEVREQEEHDRRMRSDRDSVVGGLLACW